MSHSWRLYPLRPFRWAARVQFGSTLVALAYSRLLNLHWFFRISVSVEVIALLSVVAVFSTPSFLLAAGVYLFQLALIFGNYLVRPRRWSLQGKL